MPGVAAGEVPPDQDHGRAGRDAQQDATGEVAPPERHFEHLGAVTQDDRAGAVRVADVEAGQAQRHLDVIDGLGADEAQKERAEEEDRDRVHREGLDQPVDPQRQADGLEVLAGPDDLGEVDLHHDRVHHEKQGDRDGDRHDRRVVDTDGHAVELLGDLRGNLAQRDPAGDAEQHPDGQVLLEGAHPAGGLGDAGTTGWRRELCHLARIVDCQLPIVDWKRG